MKYNVAAVTSCSVLFRNARRRTANRSAPPTKADSAKGVPSESFVKKLTHRNSLPHSEIVHYKSRFSFKTRLNIGESAIIIHQ